MPARISDNPRISRADLTERVYHNLRGAGVGVTKALAKEAVDACFNQLATALVEGEDVVINGFGGFSVRNRKAFLGRNPITGDEVPVPEMRSVTFKPGRTLKSLMNKQ